MIQDSILGPHQEILTLRSSDKKIRNKSQDGGIATSILIYALENGVIDGTIVAGDGDKAWSAEPMIATTKKEIMQGAKTKYTMCPNLALIREATRSYGLEKLGTIGTPCQVMGIRKLQAYPLGGRNLVDKIALVMGIYCMENFPYASLETFVNDKMGKSLNNVKKMNITKGKFFITTDSGEDSIPLKQTHGYEQTGCNYCMDYVAELSDLSCGSVGSKPGWSTVITRTDIGSSLIKDAINDNVFEVTETDEGKFGLEMLRKLSKNKKTKNQKNIDKKLDMGLQIPFAHSKNKRDVLENR